MQKMQFWTLEEVLQDQSEPPPPIIDDGILLENSLLLIGGKQKSGKSMLAYNFALALAEGRSFAGFKIPFPRRVMFLSAEGGRWSNQKRLKTMSAAFGCAIPSNLLITFHAGILLHDEEDGKSLRDAIMGYKPDVLIIDPLVKFHSVDENSARDMSEIMRILRDLIEKFRLSVVLIHHMGKDEGRGVRGSSAITAEYDSYIGLEKTKEGYFLDFDMRHVETPDRTKLQFNPATLWYERTDQSAVERILSGQAGMTRKELVRALRSSGEYESDGGAYKGIKKDIDRRAIVFKDELYWLPDHPALRSPFSQEKISGGKIVKS